MIHLVTYNSPDMSISAAKCKESALRNGVDKVYQWTRAALEQTEFFEANKELLSQPRGDGYWAWKPFVLLHTLMMQAKEGDYVIYADSGVEFINSVNHIVNRMDDIWLFGNQYQHRAWCKRDAMDAMEVWPEGRQCQASVIFVKKTAKAKEFLTQWLEWCCEKRLIDDSPSVAPNYPEYSEHRHDQALLTNMAHKNNVHLGWWPATYNNGAFNYPKEGYNDNYPVLFHHHRKRNNEW